MRKILKVLLVLAKFTLLVMLIGWVMEHWVSYRPVYRQPSICWVGVIIPLLMGYESILSIFISMAKKMKAVKRQTRKPPVEIGLNLSSIILAVAFIAAVTLIVIFS